MNRFAALCLYIAGITTAIYSFFHGDALAFVFCSLIAVVGFDCISDASFFEAEAKKTLR